MRRKQVKRLVRVQSVQILEGFRVQLEFTNGDQREVDLEPYLHGPVFEPLRSDPCAFASVKVDARMGTLVWDNGADIDPDVLYYGLKPAWMEQKERKPAARPKPAAAAPHTLVPSP
jgi:hypothetical protein